MKKRNDCRIKFKLRENKFLKCQSDFDLSKKLKKQLKSEKFESKLKNKNDLN